MFGNTGPTEPGMLPSRILLTAITGDVSVSPYPSMTVTPKTSSTFFKRAFGNAAPPEIQVCKEETS